MNIYTICKIKVGVNISSLDTMSVSMDKQCKRYLHKYGTFQNEEIQLYFVLLALQTWTHESP
jgi:hypothetical protein